jgi:vacuolar-type H+-ATPase subunit B/Vma2
VRHPEARTLEASMDAGWKCLRMLPKTELARLSDAQIERYIEKSA